MHPEMELFLEHAFESVRPSLSQVGRVVVEPDYEVKPSEQHAGHLASELAQCLREQKVLDQEALASHEGLEIEIPREYRLLAKYIRRITLHRDRVEGPWIEVAPPGNWI